MEQNLYKSLFCSRTQFIIVIKKGGTMDKHKILYGFGFLFISLLALFVLAAHGGDNIIDIPALQSPVAGQNVSNATRGYLILNATFDPQFNWSRIINLTFHFQNINTSYFVHNSTVQNSSSNQTIFQNLTFNTMLSLPDGIYNITISAVNGTNLTNASFVINRTGVNITIDNTAPNITFEALRHTNISNVTSTNGSIILNLSFYDLIGNLNVTYTILNGSNESSLLFQSTPLTNQSGYWNATIDAGRLPRANFTIRINATDYLNNTNRTNIVVVYDNVTPSLTSFTCEDIAQGGRQSCNCIVFDNSQNFTNASVQAIVSEVDTSVAGTASTTCTMIDLAGNRNTTSATFTVTAPSTSSSSSGGGGSSGASGGIASRVQGQEKGIWTSINEGETARVDVKDTMTLGVEEISFTVDKTTHGAVMTVQKVDTLPSFVSGFEGKSYKTLSITETNVAKVLKGPATITFKVENSWFAENKVNKNDVALFRFVDKVWTELKTTKGADDGESTTYTAETPGFSYFVIGTKAQPSAPPVETPAPVVEAPLVPADAIEGTLPIEESGSSAVAWVIAIVLLVVIAGVLFWMKKK